MSDKKNIDRLYQEKFKNFEPVLPVDLWDNIEKELPKKKKRRAIAWWYYGGIAAGIAVLFSVFYNSTVESNLKKDHTTISIVPSSKDENRIEDLKDRSAPSIYTEIEEDIQIKNDQKYQDTIENQQDGIVKDNLTKTIKNSLVSHKVNKTRQKESEASLKTTVTKTGKKLTTINKNAYAAAGSTPKNATSKVKILESPAPISKNINSELNDAVVQTVIEDNQAKRRAITNIDNSKMATNDVQLNETITDTLASNQLIEDAIALKSLEKDSILPSNGSSRRFSGSTLIAPVYSSAISGSSLNNNVVDNSTEPGYNISYGVALGYEINDRWTVRAGVHKMDVSYSTNNIRYLGGIPAAGGSIASDFDPNSIVNESDSGAIIQSFSQELVSNSFIGFTGELSQQLGYIEVPLEMRYRILKSKINLSVTGGMSALFLQENRVQVIDQNRRVELGSDDNFREFNQSANFGLGLDYNLTDQLGLMIEPMFKYQFNALSNDVSGFRPYTIALYSGLTYKF